jgi:hypothetical protein
MISTTAARMYQKLSLLRKMSFDPVESFISQARQEVCFVALQVSMKYLNSNVAVK